MKFKVGDRIILNPLVKMVGNTIHNKQFANKPGIIIKYDKGDNFPYLVKFDDRSLTNQYCEEKEIKCVYIDWKKRLERVK